MVPTVTAKGSPTIQLPRSFRSGSSIRDSQHFLLFLGKLSTHPSSPSWRPNPSPSPCLNSSIRVLRETHSIRSRELERLWSAVGLYEVEEGGCWSGTCRIGRVYIGGRGLIPGGAQCNGGTSRKLGWKVEQITGSSLCVCLVPHDFVAPGAKGMEYISLSLVSCPFGFGHVGCLGQQNKMSVTTCQFQA